MYDDQWRGGFWERETPIEAAIPKIVIPPNGPINSNMIKPKRRNRRSLTIFIILILVICGLTAALSSALNPTGSGFSGGWGSGDGGGSSGGGFGGSYYEDEYEPPKPPTMLKAETGTGVHVSLTDRAGTPLSNQDIYERNLPSIVYIEASSRFEGGTGTGVILTEDGYIITNAHVVAGASKAEVVLWNNQKYNARLVGWDADEDLAVLKIDGEDLIPAEFGDSRQLRVGDHAFAIGNPLGERYRATFTDGMISALDRFIEVDNVYMNLIQTTAPINFGNSGGALLNDEGQVIGITTIKIMSDEGTIEAMGFAIPSTRVKQVADLLIAGERVLPTTIGVTVKHVDDPVMGLRVEAVTNDQITNVKVGDIIIQADHILVAYPLDLMQAKAMHIPGETLELLILRGGVERTVQVMLQEDTGKS